MSVKYRINNQWKETAIGSPGGVTKDYVDQQDAILRESINTEAQTREEAVNELTSQVNDKAAQTSLNEEVQARIDGDDALSNSLSSEVVNREDGDNAIRESVQSETLRATGIEEELQSQISTIASGTVNIQVVAELPTELTNNTMYYVGEAAPYHLYLRANDTTYDMGTTEIDLSGYARKDGATFTGNIVLDNASITGPEVKFETDNLTLSEPSTGDTFGVMRSQYVAKVVSLTQAEYEALETKDPKTLYCVTDA